MTTGNETNEGQTRGAPIHIWVAVTSLVTRGTEFFSEQPGETIIQQRETFATARGPETSNLPFQKFSGFQNCSPEPVTPSI